MMIMIVLVVVTVIVIVCGELSDSRSMLLIMVTMKMIDSVEIQLYADKCTALAKFMHSHL